MDSLDARVYKANARVRGKSKNPLRNKAVLWVVVVIFLLCCGFAAAAVAGVLPEALDFFDEPKPVVTEAQLRPLLQHRRRMSKPQTKSTTNI